MRIVDLLFDTPLYLIAIAIGMSLLAAIYWWFFFKQRSSLLTTKNSSILMLFLVGLVMVIPLALVESSIVELLPLSFRDVLFGEVATITVSSVGIVAFVMFLIVAPMEELSKFYFLRRIMPLREIDQVIDSVKFGIAIGIGFAILENALFLIPPLNSGDLVSIGTTFFLRFFFSTLAHAVYSGIAGYFLGLAKFQPWQRRGHIAKSIFIPILIHGTFNTLLLIGAGFYALPLILILFGLLLHWYNNKKNARKYISS